MTDVFQAPDEPKALNAIEWVDAELFVDFNKVVQQSLNHVGDRLHRLNAIIRCDNLPHVHASEKDMEQLCGQLFNLILLYPPQTSKLFIYIKCNRFDDLQSFGKSNWLHLFEICFHTNSCNEASWQSAHQRELAECAAICKQHSGAFTAAYGHADCLFKLTLPGKLF